MNKALPRRGADVDDDVSRLRVLELSVGSVDDLRCAQHERSPEGFCHIYQICLPYRGLGIWHVGGEDVVADATQVVFVRGGETYRMSGPVPGGYAELIISPDLNVLDEIVRPDGRSLYDHPVFEGRSGRASPFLQKFRTRFLNWVIGPGGAEGLGTEELVIELLRAALQGHGRQQETCGRATCFGGLRERLFISI